MTPRARSQEALAYRDRARGAGRRARSWRWTRPPTSRGPGRASSTAWSCSRHVLHPDRVPEPHGDEALDVELVVAAATRPRTVLYLHSSAGRYGADRQLALIAGGLDRDRYRAAVVLPERGELAGDLRGGGRRGARPPAGGAAPRAALPRRSCRGLALRLAARRARPGPPRPGAGRGPGAHQHLGDARRGARRRAPRGAPHVWHVREIYAGFERWLAGLPAPAAAPPTALPCVSEPVRAQFGRGAAGRGAPRRAGRGRPASLDRGRARAALGLPQDGVVVALLARISGWKGHDVLVRALADPALAATDVRAVLAGAPWPGAGAPPRMPCAGWRPSWASADRVRARSATGPTPPRCTRPPTSSSFPPPARIRCPTPRWRRRPRAGAWWDPPTAGCPEIVRHGETGVLVAPGDPGALARALAELAADPERAGAAGRRGGGRRARALRARAPARARAGALRPPAYWTTRNAPRMNGWIRQKYV